jgi:phosphoethanolamine N-methyltransferase
VALVLRSLGAAWPWDGWRRAAAAAAEGGAIDAWGAAQVLTTLGDVSGRRVLELGAGIGRFTGQLASAAAHVTAADFMETSIA